MDKLKLSQLLLLGSQQVPQIKKSFFEETQEGTITGACALGMIAIAYTGNLNHKDCWKNVGEIVESLNYSHKIDPMDITFMNDHEDKTPQEISNWLASKGL